jgi:hypothetical protein
MLLFCIDPRFVDPVHIYMNARGLEGKYSQFTIAGAAIAVEANAFAAWRQTFWDNLATSIELHKIKKVITIDHRECGTARIAYGLQSVANTAVRLAPTTVFCRQYLNSLIDMAWPPVKVHGETDVAIRQARAVNRFLRSEISDRNRAFKQNGSVAESVGQGDRIRTGLRDHIGPWREPLRTTNSGSEIHSDDQSCDLWAFR